MTRVAVLKGGMSSERDVSLVTGAACAEALRGLDYDVVEIDVTQALWEQLKAANPDVIFNALHGDWGEDGRVQGVLDMFGKPYTHSGVMASSLAMDKHRAKHVLKSVGITVADGGLFDRVEISREHPIALPYVVKPNGQGSSKSVYIIRGEDSQQRAAIAADVAMGEHVVVESYIPGRELTVAVQDGKAICVTEIIPNGWYDYEEKYGANAAKHVCPAELPDYVTAICLDWAEKAHDALGCRGVSRSDFRFNDENCTRDNVVNKIVMLEVNTQPGMTPTSLVPEQAAYVGIDFAQLCRWMVEDASWPR
ncbi:D-alanine--D-alanine ligase [Litorimonas cladophorae]|uniref:D-alanine--D-alanine ligase n=1 Tax=Litorimonas cladophorae TaxID=1220491 RepID=A0A918KF27_9PROT|nr:D-alanine--D-alanine ligase [Litorimonas cladophorae]GGX60904.1 D-alanine--D-alanine ligase [Litorimonas cladophorae]